jgi:hypothetical protein
MANGRNSGRKGDSGRDPGGFAALPWAVLDCPAYAALPHPARSLLLEFARQLEPHGGNNGRLIATPSYMAARGWRSPAVINDAKKVLTAAGFLYETVKGKRPNKASWYAVTWRALGKNDGYDAGAAALFERGAYRKNAPLTTSRVVGGAHIATSRVVETPSTTTSRVAISPTFTPSPTTRDVHLSDMPSVGATLPH